MAVCRLAILSYRGECDYCGYGISDLEDCIDFAEWRLRDGETIGFDGQDWEGFIKWASMKKNAPAQTVEAPVRGMRLT